MDDLFILILGALLNGAMLAVGMMIGTRLTAKTMRKEVENMMANSETVQAVKKFVSDQTLVTKAIKFLDEATELVGSSEAKNFFANVTTLIQQLGVEDKPILKVPKKPRG